jgi:hypothetical protein
MRSVKMSFAHSLTYKPEHPDRTASRSHQGLDMDVTFQTWPSRAAMLKTIEMQESGPYKQTHWRAYKASP